MNRVPYKMPWKRRFRWIVAYRLDKLFKRVCWSQMCSWAAFDTGTLKEVLTEPSSTCIQDGDEECYCGKKRVDCA